MANYDFKKDILIGEDGEKIILEDLEHKGAKYSSDNKTNSHDLIVTYKDSQISYECKTDVYPNTGNLFVEISCRGKESGIMVTRAKWFVTYFKTTNQIWYIETDKLKELITNFTHRKVSNCGDANSGTTGYLIKKNDYKNHFQIYDSITHEKIL
jgi:phage terminase large subunit-like protein